jgi:hypothetical protein
VSDYITPARLKSERGWTDGLIKKFLGQPDKTAPNPHYSSGGAPMRLYLRVRVDEAEASAEWQAAKVGKAGARAKIARASKTTADRKRAELLAAIERVTVIVPDLTIEELRKLAVKHYNLLWASRGKYDKRASENDDPAFLDRISYNCLRHDLVNIEVADGDLVYRDDLIASLHGMVGKNDAYDALWDKVSDAITDVYPHLYDACSETDRRREEAAALGDAYAGWSGY